MAPDASGGGLTMTEYKCGDCFHAEQCEKSEMLVGFSRDNPAYCGMFLNCADVAPVRHGHWIYHPDDLFPNDSTQECSYCHAEESLTLYNENYCPNCGARMDEVIE